MVPTMYSYMVQFRDWIPGSWGGSSNELMEKDADELDLEARTFETQIELKEQELERLDHQFEQLVEKGRKVAGPKKERLKRKAKQLKRDYENKEAAWQEMLEEYTTLLAAKNAKERLEEQPQSSLRDMSEEDVQAFMNDIVREIEKRNKDTEWIQRKGDQLNRTLTSVSQDFGATMEESEIDTLFQDTNEDPVSLSELTKEEDESEDIFNEELGR
ncbi:hypothetical protein IL252_14610 (plasmid) [Halomicrobium sp. IBSBa]|uniref:Uncharacterized protein n=2 Tax=Haloarculaceae TaxID=1963268 RepID=A0A847UJK2_9EURY|nr:hypothetical protein [Halomicrobium sp. IBSBa]NLV11611.1 hypothetical protein [Halomicrobium mukohataei]